MNSNCTASWKVAGGLVATFRQIRASSSHETEVPGWHSAIVTQPSATRRM